MPISIHTLTDHDLETADAILGSAFQRSESWLGDLGLFRKLQPDGVFLARKHGIPAGMVASIIYSNFAYVGLMGVHQDFQRHGVGIALMEHLLAWTQQQKVPLVLLDASQSGQPLYEKLGFVALNEVYVLQCRIGQLEYQQPTGLRVLSPQNLDLIIASDKEAFGADRIRLLQAMLETYPGRAFFLSDGQGGTRGYLIVQEKRIGPWVMQEKADAELLLRTALSLPFSGGVVSVVVPAENTDAIALLQRYGFMTVRVNRHMLFGSVVAAEQREKIFGQASLSLG